MDCPKCKAEDSVKVKDNVAYCECCDWESDDG